MKILKWTEIENLENERSLSSEAYNKACNSPQLKWVITEKIDGTNIGLNITKDDFFFNSRNNILGKGASFYNIYQNKNLVEYLIKRSQETFFTNEKVSRVIFYGEYFGKKVLNRIDYRKDYDIKFFAMSLVLNEKKKINLSFRTLVDTLMHFRLPFSIVPIIRVVNSFKEAEVFPNDLYSMFNTLQRMEGIVIQPYNHSYSCAKHIQLLFKSKNEAFSEKVRKAANPELKALKPTIEHFRTYCTESRMYSVISKGIDKPKSKADYKYYAKAFIEDAFKDFLKDNPTLVFSEDEEKEIKNIGSLGFLIFSKILNKLEEDQCEQNNKLEDF